MYAMKTHKPLLLATLLCMSIAAQAEFRRFEARVDESTWKATQSPLQCTLSHEIPGFGSARFVSHNGREINLEFMVQSQFRTPMSGGEIVMRSLSPSWLPGLQPEDLGRASIGTDRAFVQLKQDRAWRMMTELEMGREPTFFYEGYRAQAEPIAVAISSVHFHDASLNFRRCLNQLLPYTFADIAKSTILFQFDKSDLTPAAEARLGQIRTYLTADKNIELMVIAGHTDNMGGRWFNQQLAQRRAEKVRDYLLKSGVDAKRIKLNAFGERKPVANNKTDKGRELNRRVTITISR